MRRVSTYYRARIVACFFLCVCATCLYLTLPVHVSFSADLVLQEGIFTTCKWEYRMEEKDIVLHIYPVHGPSGTLEKWDNLLSLPPWSSASQEYPQKTKRIVVANTVKAMDCERMFEGFTRVEAIDLSGLDTHDTTSMKNMFANCPRLKQLDLSKFETSNVKDMSGMFKTCLALSSVGDISKWNTSAVTDMNHMFSDCNHLTSLAVDTWDTKAVTDISGIFNECHQLASLNVGGWNTAAITNMKSAFAGCHILASAGDFSKWNTARVTNMSCLFFNNPISVDGIGEWNTSAVEDISFMFSRHHANALPNFGKWNTAAVRNMRHTFSNSHDLTTLNGLNNWNTSRVTDMSDLFSNCPNLTSVGDLSKWNTGAVEKMSYMFNGCHNLTSMGDLGMWNTGALTNTSHMFNECNSLISPGDIGKWNTSAITNMSCMFGSCSSLTTLGNIHLWNTVAVTDMGYLFNSCYALTSLDLSSWNTSAVRNMSHLFNSCHSLAALNLGSWTVSAACNTSDMFQNVYSLKNICVARTFPIHKNMKLGDAEKNTSAHWQHINRAIGGTRKNPRGAIFSSIDELIDFHNDANKEKTAPEEYVRKATPPTFVINFDKGAEDATGTMNPQIFTYNEKKALAKNAFQRAGYEFDGWHDSNGRSYTDEETFRNTHHTDNHRNEIFTAQWKIKSPQHESSSNQKRENLPKMTDSFFSVPFVLIVLGSIVGITTVAPYLCPKLSFHRKNKRHAEMKKLEHENLN